MGIKAGFRMKKHVLRPQLKIKPNIEYYVTITGPMHLGKKIGNDDKEVATLANIVNLEDGEEMEMIFGKILRESLNEQYPGDSYIGKSFAFELMKPPASEDGKVRRYNLVRTFVEIEPSEAPTKTTAAQHSEPPIVESRKSARA